MRQSLVKLSVSGAVGALTFSLFAVSANPIGWRQTETITVPEGQVRSVDSKLVVGDRATFVKTGKGTLEVPASAFDRTAENPTYAILEGTVKITDTVLTDAALTQPACCTKAAAWFSAADTSFITGSNSDIQRWYDARETNKSSPTMPYMVHALGNGFTESAASKQSLTVVYGRSAVYFGGSAAKSAGGYMQLVTAAGVDMEMPVVYHVFVVHSVSNILGSIIGSTNDPNDFFVGGSPRVVGDIGYLYYRADSLSSMTTARTYLNGNAFDIFHEKIAARADVLGVDFTERPGRFASFFNQRGRKCVSGRYGGDYLSEAVIFTNRLSEAEIVQMNRYLMKKWNISPTNANAFARLEIARDATVEFESSINRNYTNFYPFVFSGDGTVRQAGAFTMSFPGEAFKDFRGVLQVKNGTTAASRYDDLAPLLPEAGHRYEAKRQYYSSLDVAGSTIVSSVADSPDTITKTGDGDIALALDRVPASVKKLVVEQGRLSVRPTVQGLYQGVSNETASLAAVFANPNAEKLQYTGSEYVIEPDCRLKLNSNSGKNPATIDGWTRPPTATDGSSGYVILAGGAPIASWPKGLPEGNQAIFILSPSSNKVSEIYTTVRFPVAGDYLLSWRESRGYGNDGNGAMAYDLRFGKAADGWEKAATIAKRTVSTALFPRVYEKVTVAEAGEYILGFSVDSYHYDATKIRYQGVVLDEFRGDYFARNRSAAEVFEIPNGDFEETYRADGVRGGDDISLLLDSTLAKNWVFNQGSNWPYYYSGDTYRRPAVGVAGYAFPRHGDLRSNPPLSNVGRFGRNADLKEGEHMLFLCEAKTVGLGSYAETTFTVPKAGRYLLRGKVSRWNVSHLDQDYLGSVEPNVGAPKVSASITIGGSATALGELVCDRHIQEDRVWPGAFVVAADNTSVTLRLAETVEKFGAIVDDLVLVNAEGAVDDDGYLECLKNGSFEEGAILKSDGNVAGTIEDWTLVRGKKSDGTAGSTPNFYCNLGGTGRQYVFSPYDGDVVGNMRGTGMIYQKVSLVEGRYRFRIAANSRITGGYDKNGLIVSLYDEAGTALQQEIFRIDQVTNYNPHVFEKVFDLAQSGTYLFRVEGNPTHLETATGNERDNRCTAIDGVSLRRISRLDAKPPEVPAKVSFRLAAGTKLSLDFYGTAKVGTVKLGDSWVSGEISAATHPDWIEGPGIFNITGSATPGFTIFGR